MPDIQALVRYINERRIKDDGGSGYSFVRELPPTIRDTFFALGLPQNVKGRLAGWRDRPFPIRVR